MRGGAPTGNRTPVSALRGPRPDRWTMGASRRAIRTTAAGRDQPNLQQANAMPGAPAGRPPMRIHITGAARSGTTLMLALMVTCFDIDGAVARETRLWRAPARGRRIVLTKQPQDEKLALFLTRF